MLQRSGSKLILIVLVMMFAAFSLGSVSAQDDGTGDCVPPPEGWLLYTLMPEETLEQVAYQFGISQERLQQVNCQRDMLRERDGVQVFVPGVDESPFLERCVAAGYTEDECLRLHNALYGEDNGNAFGERCAAADFTPEECRRIYNWWQSDDAGNGLLERCRAAGNTEEECRRIYNWWQSDDAGNGLLERCRAAGNTEEECRRIQNGQNTEPPVGGQRPEDPPGPGTPAERPVDVPAVGPQPTEPPTQPNEAPAVGPRQNREPAGPAQPTPAPARRGKSG